jgi:hypothetical protein
VEFGFISFLYPTTISVPRLSPDFTVDTPRDCAIATPPQFSRTRRRTLRNEANLEHQHPTPPCIDPTFQTSLMDPQKWTNFFQEIFQEKGSRYR